MLNVSCRKFWVALFLIIYKPKYRKFDEVLPDSHWMMEGYT